MIHLLGFCECHISIISIVFIAVVIKTIINESNGHKRFLPTNRND